MPDGNFNGVEVAWIVMILVAAFCAQYAARRARRGRAEDEAAQKNTREAEAQRRAERDADLSTCWLGELDWPRGGTR